MIYTNMKKLKLNSVARVHEGTIPTERPPLAGELSANFCGQRVSRGQRDGSLRPSYCFSRLEPLLSLPNSWTPFQTHYSSENLVAPRIEHGLLDP
jgi:hypothetical protein